MTRFAERVLRFSGEPDEVVYAALRCWCGGFPLCPRTWRFARLEHTRRPALPLARFFLARCAVDGKAEASELHAQQLVRLRLVHLLGPWLDVAPRWWRPLAAWTHEFWRGPP